MLTRLVKQSLTASWHLNPPGLGVVMFSILIQNSTELRFHRNGHMMFVVVAWSLCCTYTLTNLQLKHCFILTKCTKKKVFTKLWPHRINWTLWTVSHTQCSTPHCPNIGMVLFDKYQLYYITNGIQQKIQ